MKAIKAVCFVFVAEAKMAAGQLFFAGVFEGFHAFFFIANVGYFGVLCLGFGDDLIAVAADSGFIN